MYIEKEWVAPNRAACAVHRLALVMVEAGRNVATVNSYPDLENAVMGQSLIGWQDRYEVPDAAFVGTVGPMANVMAFLVSEAGPFAGGIVRDDPPSEPISLPTPPSLSEA